MTATAHRTTAEQGPASDLSPARRMVLRGGYLFMGAGLAVVKWPLVLAYDPATPLDEGVVTVLLTAMSLLALLGLRYPVRLLPVLLLEVLWKLLWLGVVALPAVASGAVNAELRELIVNCSLVVVVIAVVPWRFVWRQYVLAEGDPWRPVPVALP